MASRSVDEHQRTTVDDPVALSGTKLQIVEAALVTLKTNGFAGASARAIAREGGFNQALIFYHFGRVRTLLLAALHLISDRRMNDYGPAFEAARTAPDLTRLARTIYDDDLERGNITALGEMVSGGVSDAVLGAEVAARKLRGSGWSSASSSSCWPARRCSVWVLRGIWRSGLSPPISASTCSATCSATARAPSRCLTWPVT